MTPCIAICFYGPFRPNYRMIHRGMIRCLLSPLLKHRECVYFLHTVLQEHALAGIALMNVDFPFLEIVLTRDDPEPIKIMGTLDRSGKTFSFVVLIRLDMFATAPLSPSEIHMMLDETSIENNLFMPENPMNGFLAGSPDVLRRFHLSFADQRIRCHRLGLVLLRVHPDGSIHPQDRKRCPYLEDLLLDHSVVGNDISSLPHFTPSDISNVNT